MTYVTYPGILRECRQLGFLRYRSLELGAALRAKRGLKWTVLRKAATIVGESGVLALDRMRCVFKFGVYELFRKP